MEQKREFTERKKKNKLIAFFVLVVLLFGLDQVSKYLAVIKLNGKTPVVLIDGVFELTYHENTSAAFGMDPILLLQRIFRLSYFNEHPDLFVNIRIGFLAILTIMIICFLIWFYIKKIPNDKRFLWLEFVILLFVSGALGNLADRIVNHYVVDFFYFCLIDFPVFNVADIYVTVGAILLIVLGLFYYKEEDYERILPSRKKTDKPDKEEA